jgi:hypothetical protein
VGCFPGQMCRKRYLQQILAPRDRLRLCGGADLYWGADLMEDVLVRVVLSEMRHIRRREDDVTAYGCVRSVMKPLFSAAILAVVGDRTIPLAATATQRILFRSLPNPQMSFLTALT